MFFALAIALTLAALFAVAYPVLTSLRPAGPGRSSAEDQLEELLAQRDQAFQAIRDLSFDHQVGKITDEDFAIFEANLKVAAAAALRALDKWEAQMDGESDAALEQDIAARRSALVAPGIACVRCGHLSAAGDAFCATCGQPFAQAGPVLPGKPGLTCLHCGRTLEPGDRFCAGCGQPVGRPATALAR